MPMMDNPMPPMGGDPMGGMGEQMDMGQDAPMDGEDPMGSGEPDEGSDGPGGDVRKYAGELSQALNDYNEENPNDDGKLNKYAINMIAAQVADSLSDKDKRNVIKKLKGNADDMSDDSIPQDDMEQDAPMGGNNQMNLGESLVSEIVNEIGDERKRKRHEKRITNKEVTKRNPFVSKRR